MIDRLTVLKFTCEGPCPEPPTDPAFYFPVVLGMILLFEVARRLSV